MRNKNNMRKHKNSPRAKREAALVSVMFGTILTILAFNAYPASIAIWISLAVLAGITAFYVAVASDRLTIRNGRAMQIMTGHANESPASGVIDNVSANHENVFPDEIDPGVSYDWASPNVIFMRNETTGSMTPYGM